MKRLGSATVFDIDALLKSVAAADAAYKALSPEDREKWDALRDEADKIEVSKPLDQVLEDPRWRELMDLMGEILPEGDKR